MPKPATAAPAPTLRGADIVMRALAAAGVTKIFSLSGNHIMSLYDAAIGTGIDIVHTRHEAACVHMADAWGRLTGQPGIAMVTGGPGHANAVGALYTALCAESPMILLSGHAGTDELGRGGFQEIRQAEMAAPVAKASWTAETTAGLGLDISRAFATALGGRPGPVQLNLPSDLLDARIPAADVATPPPPKPRASPETSSGVLIDDLLEILDEAQRPFFLAGPQFAHANNRDLLKRLEAASGIPVVVMESVRGLNDATLGAFGQALARADTIVLLAKPLDFTLKFGEAPHIAPDCDFVVLDPDPDLLARVANTRGPHALLNALVSPHVVIDALTSRLEGEPRTRDRLSAWRTEVRRLTDERPAAWATVAATTADRLHPAEVFRALRPLLEAHSDAILVCDGGEFAQWAQAMLPVGRRLINGVAGAIGSGLPAAIAARTVETRAPIIAVMGDGTFGFHMAELDTAVRHGLPVVVIVGNDARWNAEYQIQLREYGENRAHGCELLPTRYDQVATALGGWGETVTRAADFAPALERALAAGKPAVLNVMIEGTPSPAAPRAKPPRADQQ